MQIIIGKKLIPFNIFIWKISFLMIKMVCKFMRSFTILILSKVEITIDFNGLLGKPNLLFKYSKMER